MATTVAIVLFAAVRGAVRAAGPGDRLPGTGTVAAPGDRGRLGRAGRHLGRHLRRHRAAGHPGQGGLARGSPPTGGRPSAAAALEEILKVLGVVAIALAGPVADQQRGRRLRLRRPGRAGLPGRRGRRVRGERGRRELRRRRRSARWSPPSCCAASSAGCGATPCSPRCPGPAWRTSWSGGTGRSAPGSAVAVVLFLVAWGFHFLWNSPLLADGFGLRRGRRGRRAAGEGHPGAAGRGAC